MNNNHEKEYLKLAISNDEENAEEIIDQMLKNHDCIISLTPFRLNKQCPPHF